MPPGPLLGFPRGAQGSLAKPRCGVMTRYGAKEVCVLKEGHVSKNGHALKEGHVSKEGHVTKEGQVSNEGHIRKDEHGGLYGECLWMRNWKRRTGSIS